MDKNLLYILLLGAGALITSVLKPLFEFIKSLLDKDEATEELKFITHQEFSKEKDILFTLFVKKDSYNQYQSNVEKEFNSVKQEFNTLKGELKEIRDLQTAQGRQLTEVDKNVALIQKDLSYFVKALENVCKRKDDEICK